MKKSNIINFNDKSKYKPDSAYLIVDGNEYELESFIFSGISTEGSRMVLSWNCTLDEMISYSKIMEVTINSKVAEAMFSE